MTRGLHRSESWLAEQKAKRHVAKPSGVPTPKPSSPERIEVVHRFINGFPHIDAGKPKRKPAKVPTESQEQAAVIQWCDAHPVAKHIFAIPNGSHKSPAMAAKFKREGLRAGVPDLFLPVPFGGWAGLFVEMKRTKGSVTSKEQLAWIDILTLRDFACVVCKGADEAIAAIKHYLGEV